MCGWKANTTYYFITDHLFLAGFAPLLCAWPSAVTPPPWGLSKLGTANLFLLFWYQFLKVHSHLSVWFFLVFFFFFPLFSGITSSASLKVGVDQKSNPISLCTPHTPAENLRSTQSSQYHKGPATTDAPAQSRSYRTRPVLPPPIWTPLPWQSTRTSDSTCVTCKTEPLSPPFKGPILEGWHHNCIPPSNESVSQGDSISQTS